MIQKLYLRGPGAHCYFLKHHYVLLKERSWSPDGKRLYGFPLCIEHHLMLFFKELVFWSCRDFVIIWKGEKVWEPLWKTALPTLIFWALWLFWLSSLLFCLSLWGLTTHSLCLYYMAHSSWHILLVLSDRLEGVKSPRVLFLILSGQQAYFQR